MTNYYHDNDDDNSSSSSEEDASDIRDKAFALLNKIGRDQDDDEEMWPQEPKEVSPPKRKSVQTLQSQAQQQQQQYISSYQRTDQVSSQDKRLLNQPPSAAPRVVSTQADQLYEDWGVMGATAALMVGCIVHVCQKSADYVAGGPSYDSIASMAMNTTNPIASSGSSQYHDDAQGEFEKVSILNSYKSQSQVNNPNGSRGFGGQTSGET